MQACQSNVNYPSGHEYSYGPFGERNVISETVPSDFGYAGYYDHAPSGLNLTMYRAYSPSLGRWLSRDPIGMNGGTNLYCYAINNPIGFIDMLGLEVLLYGHPAIDATSSLSPYPGHLSLRAYPDDPSQFTGVQTDAHGRQYLTISAGPSKQNTLNYQENRSDDSDFNSGCNVIGKINPPGTMANDDYIKALLQGASAFPNNAVPYDILYPNSNAFLHGLINSVGGNAPNISPVLYPGWGDPLPSVFFERK
jgi:RHS repeat-associated protein